MGNLNTNSKRLLINTNYLENDIFIELQSLMSLCDNLIDFNNIGSDKKQEIKKYLGRKNIIDNFIIELLQKKLLQIKEQERFDGSIDFTLEFNFKNL